MKKAQKKFHKIIVKGIGKVTYLHSTTKQMSYATNGRVHADGNNRNMLCLDISSFFTGISREKVYKTIKDYLKVDNDVAYYYSKLLTAPLKKDSKDLFLAQGLPSSPVLAFLCYKTLFDYINDLSIKNNITFTLYVDDITFSSVDDIPQEFINTVMGLLKSKKYHNNLIINKKKTHNNRKCATKKVTGVYINNGKPSVSRKKHFETFTIYSKLIIILHDELRDLNSYFEFYNLFLKFSGNLIHIFQVEHNGVLEKVDGCSAHNRMLRFYKELSKFIRPGLIKKEKGKTYSVDNIDDNGLKICERLFSSLIKNQNKLKSLFPKVKRNILE